MQGPIYATMAIIAGLATGTQLSTPIDAEYIRDAPELCAIYLDESPDGTYLAAYAAEGIDGEYVFSLRESGPDGTSQITQSGEFIAGNEGPTLLSEMMLDLSGSYEASLQTYTWEGEFTCRAIV